MNAVLVTGVRRFSFKGDDGQTRKATEVQYTRVPTGSPDPDRKGGEQAKLTGNEALFDQFSTVPAPYFLDMEERSFRGVSKLRCTGATLANQANGAGAGAGR